ncbi:MAG: hypothetical protein WKG01_39745 [Kofleriaceae bacterium]
MMRRLAAMLVPLAVLGSIAAATLVLVEDSAADLDNLVFTSKPDRIRMVVPRGWRATDQPSYPGLLLWMMRSQPPGRIVLTSETFTRELFCSWPVTCRATQEPVLQRYVCALRQKLQGLRMKVGGVQPGPKENDTAGMPSVYFEYEDGNRFLRHAFTFVNDRFVSLVLSAPTNEARATHLRPFDQALRTLRTLTLAETAPVGIDAGLALEAGPTDGSTTLPLDGAAPVDAGVVFESAPTPQRTPIGPCP